MLIQNAGAGWRAGTWIEIHLPPPDKSNSRRPKWQTGNVVITLCVP